MFTIRMAEISEHAGDAGDGIVRGYVAQSLSTAAYSSIETKETVYAFNLDVSGGNFDFTDYTTQCTSGNPNTFLPWSDTAHFSSGDCLYVASEEPTTQIRFTIDTGALWSSSFPGPLDQLDIRDSTDGISPNRVLTVTQDTSNGFRSTGTVTVTWTAPTTPGVEWSPVPGFIANRKWICIAPKGYTGSTRAPGMSMTYMLGIGADMVDLTSVFNDPMDSAIFPPFDDVVYMPGEAMLFTFSDVAIGMDIEVHRKSAAYYTMVLEYYSTSGFWTPFTDPIDPSAWMTNGPAVLGVNPQLFHLRWSLPLDWGPMPLTIPIDPYPHTLTLHGAHMRARVDTVSNNAPTPPPLARARARSLDHAGGVYHLAQGVYTALTYEATIPPLIATDIQIINKNTHAAAVATFPAHGYSSTTIYPQQRVILSNPIQINANESMLITWEDGGKLQDVEIVLE